MICVFDIGNEKYTGNGDAVLIPTEAKVKMVAGGNYDLTMTHPMDPDGKWRHLVPGAVLRVPVPEEEIENAFAGMDVDVYKVSTATDLREGPTEPETINYPAWSETTAATGGYSVGSKVSFGQKNYQCTYMDSGSIEARVIPSNSSWWTEIPRTTPGAAVLVSLPVDSELYFVENVDSSWYKMSTYYGIVGYVKTDKVTYDRHLTPSETKPRIITDQLLRITNATADTKGKTVSVTAQHVSYDLNGVIIKDISIAVASPGMALARIVDGFMIPYPGTIATNLDSEEHGTYTGDIKGKSGMYALLDPDKGIVGTFDAAFKRDNWDLFVMEKTNTDRGFQLRRQKNLLGVNWTRKSDGLINRVVPVAKHEGGEDLYLPEVWIDSPDISDYPVIRMEMLSMKEQVGKDKGTGDGSVWTEEELQDEMRARAAERFSVDRVDQVITEVTVDFEMLGATAEYAALKPLEKVLLYDKVTVIDETIGLDTQLTVTELEWDALKKKVTSIKISNAEDHGSRSVTGYNVQSKSIGWSKLTDEVQGDILNQVKDIIPQYSDPSAPRPATVNVVDGNPTLSWGNRSVVGTVQGTEMHVTMPANPADSKVSKSGDNMTGNLVVKKSGSNQDGFVGAANDTTGAMRVFLLASYNGTHGLYSNGYFHNGAYVEDGKWLIVRDYDGLVHMRGEADSVAWTGVTGRPSIIDNLTSTSATDALSAKQGKVLNEAKANGKQATWITNGYDPIANETGYFCYSTNPNNLPAQGLPTGANSYGTVFGDCSGAYNSMFYLTVLGDLYLWKTNGTPEWYKLALKSEVPAVINNLTSTSATDALSANQGKVLNDTTVKLTGNQTISGAKTFNDVPRLRNSATSPAVYFQGTDLASANAVIQAAACEASGEKFGNPRFTFSEYSPSSDGTTRTNYLEQYLLPAVDTGRTSNAAYNILTTKNNAIYDGLDSTSTTRPLSANQGKVLNDTKANVAYQSWGTSLTVNAVHALVLVGYDTHITVWLPGSSGINVFVAGTSGNYNKQSTSNTITFGRTASTGTEYTVTRSGSSFKLTSTGNTIMTAISK